jgi:ABC-type dipeptide/oligopeptide/nickel transport system ATPase component
MPKPALPLFGRRTKLTTLMSNPTPLLLQVRGLMKDEGGRRVVDDVSFDGSAGVEDGPSDELPTSPTYPSTQALLSALPRGVPRVPKETHPMLPSPASGGGPPLRSRRPESTSQCRNPMPKLETLSEGRRVRCFNRNTVHD